jgi:hypothetical protein
MRRAPDAIVLSGEAGTRLQYSHGRCEGNGLGGGLPFLELQLRQLWGWDIEHVILAVWSTQAEQYANKSSFR